MEQHQRYFSFSRQRVRNNAFYVSEIKSCVVFFWFLTTFFCFRLVCPSVKPLWVIYYLCSNFVLRLACFILKFSHLAVNSWISEDDSFFLNFTVSPRCASVVNILIILYWMKSSVYLIIGSVLFSKFFIGELRYKPQQMDWKLGFLKQDPVTVIQKHQW